MAGNRELAVGLIAIAALIALVAMFSPWWTLSLEVQGEGFDGTSTERAGPFDANDMIPTGAAVLTGILTLVALLALLAAAGIQAYTIATQKTSAVTPLAPLIALAGAGFLLLGVVLAIFMYGGELDMGFWDRNAGGAMGFAAETVTYAAWGWYLAIVGALAGGAGGFMALRGAESPQESSTREGAEGQGS